MKYYSHHIGDFDRATRHLTRIERSVYRDLIDLYYDTEQPLSLDIGLLCRKIIARTDEERTAVEQTLNEFFTETPRGWYHDRCEAELEVYRASTTQKSAAGRASAAKRALKREQAINEIPTPVERPSNGTPTNQQPTTINQEPVNLLVASAPGEQFALVPPEPVKAPKRRQEDRIDDNFERAWSRYPKRHGGNSKLEALEAWNARLKEGIGVDEIIAGVERYAEHMRLANKIGTQFVKTAAAFFGPKLHFREDWPATAPPGLANTGRPSANAAQQVAGLDHSSSVRAMEESMKRHGVEMPLDDDDDPIDFN